MRSHHRKSFREFVAVDLDIMPLMNLFVVLVPMMLMSAVFVQVAVVDMQLPPANQEAWSGEADPLTVEVTVLTESYRIESGENVTIEIDRSTADADQTLREALTSLRTAQAEVPLLTILSPAEMHYQDLITVMDIGAAAGLGAVSLSGLNEH